MALLVVMVTIGGFALPVAADQSLRIVSPKDGATVTGPDITVTVDAGSLHLVPAGDAKSLNDEHIHYLLDVDPAPYLDGKRDIPFGDPHIIHTADLTHTFKDVPAGQHQVTVILTYANHIATQPAVAPTIHFTVSGGMAWEALAKLPTARYAMGVATLNGKVYAIGGSDGSDPMNTVEAYDPTTNAWAVKAPMPTPRLDLGVAVAGGKIYAIGGFDGNQRLASVEAYDPTTNTWSARASLPTARSALGVATGADGKIYAIGGCSGNECNRLATVEAYDPQSNSWTARAPLPAARSGLAVVGAPNGELYAIGGCTGSLCDRVATVDAYNPATNSWAAKSSLPSPRDAFGAALGANGKIYVVGGSNTGKSLADVLQYDPTIDTWTPMTSLPTARSGLSLAATPDGKLLAIGGIGSGGLVELATAPGPLLPAPAEVASAAQPGAFPYLPVGVGIVVIGAL
ncbi:MAG TPA: kelch repeat-containing protein, partial [Chloroflexota bacterium]|nr:kelch repeat-containing protein [Chloroflexota bacterium]